MPENKVHFPYPEEYIRDYVSKLFRYIKKGECVTLVWVGTAGRRVVTKFVINNIDLFEKEVPNNKNYLFAYVEPLDLTEESQPGYLRLLGKTFIEACQKKFDARCNFSNEDIVIFDDEKATYSKLLESLRNVVSKVTDRGIEVVLFLGEFDELTFVNSTFSNNLRSLWNRFDNKLHYVFLIKDTRLIFENNPFGEELGYLFFQNILYTPVTKDNENYLIDYFQKRSDYVLTPEKRELVSELCDGHPYLLKLAIETLSKEDLPASPLSLDKAKELLRSNYEIRGACERMIGVLTERSRKMLLEIGTKDIAELPNDEDILSLQSLGLARRVQNGNFQLFCKLFRDAVLKRSLPEVVEMKTQGKIAFDTSVNSITVDGKPIDDRLTRQEYELLSYFLKVPDRVHSRDEIAETLWGKESFDKYSDWAIDQLISKLRKKLTQLGMTDGSLVTIRGRGYKFIV